MVLPRVYALQITGAQGFNLIPPYQKSINVLVKGVTSSRSTWCKAFAAAAAVRRRY